MAFATLSIRTKKFVAVQPVSRVSRTASRASRRGSRGMWLKLMVLALAVLAAGGKAWALDQCSTLSSYSGSSNVDFVVTLFAGDKVTINLSSASSGGFLVYEGASTHGTLFILDAGPSTNTYTIPATSAYYFNVSNYEAFGATHAYTLSCVSPPVYTVTVTTDPSTATASNCTLGGTTDASCSLRDALAAVAANTNVSSTNPAVVKFSPTAFSSPSVVYVSTNNPLVVPNNTTIQGLTTGSGASLQNLVTVYGQAQYQLFSVASGVTATISNLQLNSGSAASGAAIYNAGNLTVNQSSLINNIAYLQEGGAIYNSGTLTITGSTIASNSSASFGGGIFSSGTLTIVSSTIANNTAFDGGGIYIATGGTASFTNVTVTGNSASDSGGGVYAISSGALSYNNSIVEANSASTHTPDSTGAYSSTGTNLVSSSFYGSSPYTSSTLRLAPVGSYGGPTLTMPALPGSPALCAASTGSGTDQRGVARPTSYGSVNCSDIGATNSSFGLAFTTQPAATYNVNQVMGSSAPVVQFTDDGYALLVNNYVVQFTDADNVLGGSTVAGLVGGKASPTSASFSSTEQSDTISASTTVLVAPGGGASTPIYPTTPSASNSFAVVSPLTAFALSTLTTPVAAGTTQSVTVTAQNAGVTATGYTGTATFTSTDTAATLPGNGSYTFTSGDAGVHTFTNGLAFKTAGTQTLTVKDTGASVSKTSNNVTVTAGAAASGVSVGTSTLSAATGAAFSATALQVQVLDAYGNPVSGVTVTYSVPSSGASAVLGTTTCVTNASGVCSVTATANSIPGAYSITATISGVSTPVTFHANNTGVLRYTVTVSTDTTTGTAGNCTANSTTDASCSLRDALAAAAALPATSTIPVTIQFSPTAFTAATTITLGSAGTLTIPTYTTIQGLTTGSGVSLQNLITVSGANTYSIFNVATGSIASINNLTISNGSSSTNFTGAALSIAGTLTLNQDTVSYNASTVNGGSVFNQGTLTVNNSTFANNSTTGGNGGVIFNTGTFIATSSTFTGNSAIFDGGAIYAYSGSLTLTNSTVSANTANSGGGMYYTGGTLTLNNSIVAGNKGVSNYADISPVTPSGSGSLYYTGSAATTPSAYQPRLSSLGSYGGPTQTMYALPGSPALCTGTAANVSGVTLDQTGRPRTATYGSTSCVDAGSVQTNYSLAFVQQPTNVQVNSAITPSPTVQVYNNGLAVAQSGVTIGASAALGGLTGNPVTTSSAGLATLSGYSINAAETNDTLTAYMTVFPSQLGSAIASTTSSTFNVIGVDHLVFTTVPTTATAGTSFNVTVTAYISTDNSTVATGYTGPVKFTSTDGSAVFPTSPISLTAGVGTFTITLKTAGVQTITVADSSGSPTVTSGSITVSAAAASVITAISGTPQSAVIGAVFGTPLGVKVTDAYGNPIGGNVVTFSTTGGSSGQGALLASGTTCTTSTVAATLGTCSITATANGFASNVLYAVIATAAGVPYNTSYANFLLTNLKASPALTVTISPTSLVYGQPVTITATSSITSLGGSSPTGAVTFYDSPTTLTPTGTLSNGKATYNTFAGAGSQYYAASLASDNNFNAVAQTGTNPAATPVGKASSTLTGPTGQPVLVIYGTTGSITINVGGQYAGGSVLYPSGSIGYTLNGVAGTAAISSTGVATIPVPNTLPANLYTIPVTYGGDGLYNGATSISVGVQVGQITPTIGFTPSSSSIVYGTSLGSLLSASASNNSTAVAGTFAYTATLLPSGTAFAVTSSTVLPAGSYTLSANFTPSNTSVYKSASGTAGLTVTKATPVITLGASPAAVFILNPTTLTATVTGVTGGLAPTNAVTFSVGGTALTPSQSLNAGSPDIASTLYTPTSTGALSVTASYAGDSNYNPVSTLTATTLTAVDFTITPYGTVAVTATPGTIVNYGFTITPVGATTFPGTISLTVAGSPTGTIPLLNAQTVAANTTSSGFILSVTAPVLAQLERPGSYKPFAPVVLALLLLPFSGKMRRRAGRLGRYASLLLLLVASIGTLAGLTGCGTGVGLFAQSPKTYTFTVTGTAGALTHSATVTLVDE